VWLNLDPHQGLDPSARGLVSGERSPLKGVLRGEMAWGDGLEGEGLVPDCLGWLRVVGGPVKALDCKQWVAIGEGLLRFPLGGGLEFPMGAGLEFSFGRGP
jgi:hypothetical protein